ncbi:MAG TPA: class I SAM-dependent methyltransferase [Casimicrobiaceae bacterium]
MADYYDHARLALLDLFPRAPERLLDVGCGNGATGAAAKARWPGVETIGIELVPEAAQRAAARLDRVIAGSVETLDLAAAGIAGVDGVLLLDVLEHLVDPWRFLERLRAVLDPAAMVVASIPNVANLWLLDELAAGRFAYAADGLLDKTHLRFFTRQSIAALFDGAGYDIERWERITDGRVDDATRRRILGVMLPVPLAGRIAGRRVTVRGANAEAYHDLRTIQFTLVARPRTGKMGGIAGDGPRRVEEAIDE